MTRGMPVSEVLAVRSAFPAHRHTQAELTARFAELGRLDRSKRALLDRLHGNAGVETRHTVLPLDEYGTHGRDRPDQRPLHRRCDRAG